MGPAFLFFPELREINVMSFRNPKSKKGFRIVVTRTKQIIKSKKIFSRNIPPHVRLLEIFIWEKIKRYVWGFLREGLHTPRARPTNNTSQGRRRRRRPWLPICAGCTKISSKLYTILPLDFFPNLCYNEYKNNNRNAKNLKKFFSNTIFFYKKIIINN
jgi:hypothetical protein